MNKNYLIIALAGLLVVGLVAASITGIGTKTDSGNNIITGNTIKTTTKTNQDVQRVNVLFENYAYKFSDTLIKDVPVELIIDMNTVTGCMRDVVISAFGVRQYVQPGDNVIRFTPDKAGTFNIACSMNMGRGTFTVVEADGSESNFKETAPAAAPTGGSCGSNGGGCGCGGA